MIRHLLLFAASLIPLHAQIPSAPGAQPKLVAADYKFTEGPAADQEGNVYFTDQPNNRILKWSASTGEIEPFMEPAGRSNGLYFTRDGQLLACADEKSELWSIDPKTRKITILLTSYDHKLFNSPNDVWAAPNGDLYFTDPFCKRDYWQGRDKPEQEQQRVFYLPKGAKIPLIADAPFVRPNGIIGSSDGKLLFVSDIGGNKTYQYEISPTGELIHRKLFCELGSDGMTLDTEGNLYLTGKGVTVFDKTGKKLGNIPIDQPWTANITFGGKDYKTLFITASNSVYTLEMTVAGVR